eukprot:scaffold35814_cov25-Cyclotella_meneghiniana.AAC.2
MVIFKLLYLAIEAVRQLPRVMLYPQDTYHVKSEIGIFISTYALCFAKTIIQYVLNHKLILRSD